MRIRVDAYDRIGRSYADFRQPDPRLASQIRAALDGTRTVVNVGAGAGSYEPRDLTVVAVEPSRTMLAQRPDGAAPAVAAVAERLPFADDTFDASLAVLTHHHWTGVEEGFAELRRVARRHVVFTWDPRGVGVADFWLIRDYFPQLRDDLAEQPALDAVLEAFPDAAVSPVPIPQDCRDGFMAAYWKRPDAYLDPGVRRAISSFARRDDAVLRDGLRRLEADLASGAWGERNRELRDRDVLDLGYRLVVAGDRAAHAQSKTTVLLP